MTFLTPFTPSKGPLAVVLAYNSSRTALMSALLLVSALSHGAERSREQRNNKCPGKTTAVGFGIVPRSGAGNREIINVQGRYCNVLLL
jgi:hypothetical protein